jgi:hypothetical protein
MNTNLPVLAKKTFNSLKRNGVINTFYLVLTNPFRSRIGQRNTEIIFSNENLEHRFTKIYQLKYWGRTRSASGGGSTLEYTENLRNKLPDLLKKYSILSMFDAPCGDLNWMKHVLKKHPVNYIGGDIVAPLVESNNKKYKTETIKFMQIDLTKDRFPSVDLMLCRDCLIHLSNRDIKAVLQNFIDSKIKYLFTTTLVPSKEHTNEDVSSGDHREIDLFSAPFNFPADVLYRIEDWQAPDPKREMCLWSRDQVMAAVDAMTLES